MDDGNIETAGLVYERISLDLSGKLPPNEVAGFRLIAEVAVPPLNTLRLYR